MCELNRYAVRAVVVAMSLWLTGNVTAGSLDSTNPPAPTMHTLEEIYQKVQNLTAQSTTSAPMHTLEEIYQKLQNATPQTLRTFSATTTAVTAGYYAATNLTQVDTDLVAVNIRTNVTIFGVAGTLGTNATAAAFALVPRTGQTASNLANDDGTYRKGVAWPSPRFTVQANTNCVLDNLTGLIWARNASVLAALPYSAAASNCENLVYGGQSDWRVPNFRELESLLDYGTTQPPLPAGHPFGNVDFQTAIGYWTSSGSKHASTWAYWCVKIDSGTFVRKLSAANGFRVWPVRGP